MPYESTHNISTEPVCPELTYSVPTFTSSPYFEAYFESTSFDVTSDISYIKIPLSVELIEGFFPNVHVPCSEAAVAVGCKCKPDNCDGFVVITSECPIHRHIIRGWMD